jgi:hypothetical protein
MANESPSTFELLRDADLHLSISSTCHYDALGLGVPTVILPFRTHEVVGNLVEAGHAERADSPADLLRIVLGGRGRRVPPEVGGYYYEPGSLENMGRELDAIRARGAA